MTCQTPRTSETHIVYLKPVITRLESSACPAWRESQDVPAGSASVCVTQKLRQTSRNRLQRAICDTPRPELLLDHTLATSLIPTIGCTLKVGFICNLLKLKKRRRWNLNLSRPNGLSKLQTLNCHRCHKCHRCRRPLHAIARWSAAVILSV